jgi:type IV pilus assembly protein PilM
MLPTPEGAVTDGQLANPEELAAFLTAQLRANSVRATAATFVIASGRIATREVSLPPVKASRLAEIVRTNAADYFPVNLSGYHIAHTVLGESGDAESRTRVMVYAAPLALLEGYFRLAAAAELKIRAIDYAGNAEYNVYRAIDAPGVNLYVYVNHGSTYLTFMEGRSLLLQRTLTYGGGELLEEFLSVLGGGTDRYLDAYRALSDPEREAEALGVLDEADILASLGRLSTGIARSLDYFTSNYADTPVENIVLTGPLGRLLRLREAVASATGHNTVYMDELPEAQSRFRDARGALPFIDCAGALLAPPDLLPARFTQAKKKAARFASGREASLKIGVAGLAVLLAASGALTWFGCSRWRDSRGANAGMLADIAALEYTEPVYNSYLSYVAGADAILNVRALTSSPNDNLAAFLSELELKLPREILVLSAVCSRDGVAMTASVPRKSDVARVMVQLRSFESIAALTLPSISVTEDGTGVPAVSFAITCAYRPLAPLLAASEGGAR